MYKRFNLLSVMIFHCSSTSAADIGFVTKWQSGSVEDALWSDGNDEPLSKSSFTGWTGTLCVCNGWRVFVNRRLFLRASGVRILFDGEAVTNLIK